LGAKTVRASGAFVEGRSLAVAALSWGRLRSLARFRRGCRLQAVRVCSLGFAVFVAWRLAAGPPDALGVVNHVAAALADGNPSDAIAAFDKSFTGYSKLQQYFVALTDGFLITNEAELTDESDDGTELTLHWSLTLKDKSTDVSRTRGEDIRVKLAQKEGKWKIVELSPVEFFDPLRK